MKCYAKSSENLIVQLANLPPKPPFLSKSFHLFSCTGKTHYLCISSAKNKEQNKTFLPFNFQNIGRQLVQYAASEKVLDCFNDEFDYRFIANCQELTDMAVAIFVGLIDTPNVTTGGGGGGSQSDLPWRDKDEDDLLWARRCARAASRFLGKKPKTGLKR